ncbi:MAG: NGG1p interacting factor NIF3 [Spirochaetaceae bacterium]|nr:MAG: NGG1p interacting factor NIF3 [Spirochaetaceae bacterium]
MFKLVFFVPPLYVDEVKLALFEAGGGRYEKYDFCSWQTMGTGQFRPLQDSNPFIGRHGEVERVEEYRVEILLRDDLVVPAVRALVAAHPYEEPAYEVYRVYQLPELEGGDVPGL